MTREFSTQGFSTQGFSVSRRMMLAATGALAGSSFAVPRVAMAADLPTVDIVNTQGGTGLAIQELSVSQGYFKQVGAEARILNVSDGSKVLAGLFGGTSDICIWSGFNSVLAAIEKGAKIKILSGALLFPTHAVFTKRADIKSVKDLAGKTIGVGALGAQLHQEMIALFLKKKIDPSTVTFRNVGSSQDVFRAVAAGTVDAGPSEVDMGANAKQYGVTLMEDAKLWIEVPEFTFQAGYATQDAIDHKRDLLVKALAAFGQTFKFVQSPQSKDAFVKANVKTSGKSDTSEAETQWGFIQEFKPYDTDLVLSPERIKFMQELNMQLGVQNKVLPFEAVADMSLAQDALKLMAKNPI